MTSRGAASENPGPLGGRRRVSLGAALVLAGVAAGCTSSRGGAGAGGAPSTSSGTDASVASSGGVSASSGSAGGASSSSAGSSTSSTGGGAGGGTSSSASSSTSASSSSASTSSSSSGTCPAPVDTEGPFPSWADCSAGVSPTLSGGDMVWALHGQQWFFSCAELLPDSGPGQYLLGPTGDVVKVSTCMQSIQQGSAAFIRFNGAGSVVIEEAFVTQADSDVDAEVGPAYIGPDNHLVISYRNVCQGEDAPPACPEGALEDFNGSVDWPSVGFVPSQSDVLGDVFGAPDGPLQRGGPLGSAWSAPATPGAFVPDQTGGVLLFGALAGTVDFGCGPVSPSSSSSGYLARIDASSACVYSRALPAVVSVIADTSGGAVASVSSTTGLDLGCGALAAAPSGSTLVTRLDAAGGCVFGASFAAPGLAVALDASGRVVLSGLVAATPVDFGGGPLAPLGSQDVVLGELDASGHYLWGRRFGGPGVAFASETVSTSAAGDVYLLTGWSGAVDLGGGAITAASGDTVVGSYSSTGAYRWSRGYSFGSPSFVGIDGCGSLVVAGGTLPCAVQGLAFGNDAIARFAP
jgi:hypothetical protein